MNEFEQCDLAKETNDFHNTYTFYQNAIHYKKKRKCFKDVRDRSEIIVCEVKFGAKIFPVCIVLLILEIAITTQTLPHVLCKNCHELIVGKLFSWS